MKYVYVLTNLRIFSYKILYKTPKIDLNNLNQLLQINKMTGFTKFLRI